MAERRRRSNPALNTPSEGVPWGATASRIRNGTGSGRPRRPKAKWTNPILPECGALIEEVINRGPAIAKYEHVTALLAELLLTRETLDALCPKFELPSRVRELCDMLDRSVGRVKRRRSCGQRNRLRKQVHAGLPHRGWRLKILILVFP